MSSDEQVEEGLLLAVGPELGPPAADGTFCHHHGSRLYYSLFKIQTDQGPHQIQN